MPSTPGFGRRGLPSASAPAFNRPNPAPRPLPTPDEDAFNVWRFLFGTEGRIPRLHYWLGQICIIVVDQIIIQSDKLLLSTQKSIAASASPSLGLTLFILAMSLIFLVILALTVWAGIALVVRRWHDRGKSWVWALLGFVPIVGWLWQGIECGFLEGTLGPNRYGPSPKGITGVSYGDQGAIPVA
ncbi:MAG TPA: DUF805 domain-containing protein [Caulobacteraceae bacterium]|jgi:uncharacterized membrane protein YhaH (DUF805 family)